MLRAYLGMRDIGDHTNIVGGVKCSTSYSCVASLLDCLGQLFKIITTIPARGAKEVNVGEGVHMLPRYGVSPELLRRVRSDKELQRLKHDPLSAGSNNVWSVNNALMGSIDTALTRSFCTRSNVRLSRSADAQSPNSTKRVPCARKLSTHAA
jgi:hypothetical protein